MKDILKHLKTRLPSIQDKLLESLPILLIYSALLFVLSPNIVNQLALFALIFVFMGRLFLSKT